MNTMISSSGPWIEADILLFVCPQAVSQFLFEDARVFALLVVLLLFVLIVLFVSAHSSHPPELVLKLYAGLKVLMRQ